MGMGANCTSNDGAICSSCNDGYTLEGTICQANTCTCDNGVSATGAACTSNDASICLSCNDGYTLEGTICQAKPTCGGTANGAACKFPFTYQGTSYNTCTSAGHVS